MKKYKIFISVSVFLWACLCFSSFCEAEPLFSFLDLEGFFETDYGVKVSDDKTKRDSYNFLEQRFQLKTIYYFEGDNYFSDKGASLNYKGDFVIDEYYNGKTAYDLRELNLSLTPFDFMDAKIGRQILTWGTGDYLFINDLFPKDYISFFIGRDDEYLKKSSDAVKLSFYPNAVNVDFVASVFSPNTIAKGDRLSFFDSFQGGIAGVASDRSLLEPPMQLSNNEYALRFYRNLRGKELAAYFFHGFDKNPTSYKDELARQLYYRRLDAYGFSLRGPFAKGIGNIEFGYYRSREDSSGVDRLIANSSLKFLWGYNKDLGNDYKMGFQHMYEQMMDYGAYQDSLLSQDYVYDEYRHLLTTRLTKSFMNQTFFASFFVFYSPSDKDGYVRPFVSYDFTDQWKATFGANLPWGEDDLTEFGQNKRNKNIFLRIRFSF